VAYFVAVTHAKAPIHVHQLCTYTEAKPRPPLQRLAFTLIQLAFRDCRSLNRQHAADGLRWIRMKSDWTALPITTRLERWGTCAPPPDVRTGFVLSFDFCCGLLDWDPDQVRKSGVPIPNRGTAALHDWVGHGGLSSWREWREQRRIAQAEREAREARRVERLALMRAAREQMRESQPRFMEAHA